jgi:hypothetical protein
MIADEQAGESREALEDVSWKGRDIFGMPTQRPPFNAPS